MGLPREEGQDNSNNGGSKNDGDSEHASKQVFGQAAPQEAILKYTTFEGISQ